ncbi:MAG: T9SS type A sorting domain-containing protein [Candidatus Cloacimonetes bacterium]|nr:T9SS type A sorting domain-containing protein [Candidatus Cloacimonadota bacterium]
MKIVTFIILLGISISASGLIIFVVNSGSETLSRIDTVAGEVDNVFAVLGNQANRIALYDDCGLVVNSGDNNLQKINLNSGATISYIYLEPAANPYDLTIYQDHAYVSGALSNRIYKVNLQQEIMVDAVQVGNNPAGLAVYNNKLYVGNTNYTAGYENCTVSVVDLDSFSLVSEIPVPANPQFLMFYADMLHVCCTGNWVDETGIVVVIDPVTGDTIASIEIGGYPVFFAETGSETIYLADALNEGIYAYDANSFEIIYDTMHPFLPGGSAVAGSPQGLAVLGGEWGQNFDVWYYDNNEVLLGNYTVGVYGTDIKIREEGSAVDENLDIGSGIILEQNYPNPLYLHDKRGITPTVIHYHIFEAGKVNIELFDIKGKRVAMLYTGWQVAGSHMIAWRPQSLLPGIYIYRLSTISQQQFRKLCILK